MRNLSVLNTLRGFKIRLNGPALTELSRQISAAAGAERILITGERGTEKEAAARQIACLSAPDDLPPEETCLVRYLKNPEELEDISFLNAALGRYAVFGDCAFWRGAVQQKLKLLLINNQLDVKFIFLTSARLRPLVLSGGFDEELYRLMLGREIYLPALSERENFADICQELLEEIRRQYALTARSFAPETLIALSKRPWPGNIVQLKAAIYALAARAKTELISQP
ncbi:MAG: hypothetical protein LBD99_06610 [Candidatus Margulisbacteria bacterium]|jgi:DNA-binding NtrC family response regulator|nr:hypothetical protein [Candidatus Margulisiibacteriota bacterium]